MDILLKAIPIAIPVIIVILIFLMGYVKAPHLRPAEAPQSADWPGRHQDPLPGAGG